MKKHCDKSEMLDGGFTLIESLTAMGLFVGVVFLLVSVFNQFLMDDFNVKMNRALVVAENQMDNTARSKIYSSSEGDTLGFHVVQTVTMRDDIAVVDVAVKDNKNPRKEYIRLTKAFPIPQMESADY